LISWAVPVVLSDAVPIGTAIVFDPTSVVLHTDGAARLEWDATRASRGTSSSRAARAGSAWPSLAPIES